MKIPLAEWLRGYRREWLHADVVGGLSAAAVVIPKAMAYAAIGGLPVQTGLYTALAAMLVYPFAGTARALSVTTTSAIATLTAAQVVTHAGSGVAPVWVAATLAALVGAVLVAACVFRLGFFANFISKPVLIGFEAGIGIVIVLGQLKSILGVSIPGKTSLDIVLALPVWLPQVHHATAFVALMSIALLVAVPRVLPRAPVSLLCIALAIAVSAIADLGALGIKTIGELPAGLPSLALPDLSLAIDLLPAAAGIALMCFTESIAAARTFTRLGDPPVNPNRELAALGAANLGAALVGGMPAGGGTSQTAVADSAGVRSQLAQWISALAVTLTLLFLAGVIGLLPQAALGAIILVAAASMIKPAAFVAIAHVRRDEVAWALVTMAGVVLIGTLEGILIAVGVSVVTLIYQANHPPVYAVAWSRAENAFQKLGDGNEQELIPGLLLLRTEGRLTFANAENVAMKMRALLAQLQPRVVVLECSAIPDIEYTALLMLSDAQAQLRLRGIDLWLAGVNPDLRKILERSALASELGGKRVYLNLHHALIAWRMEHEAANS